MRCLDYRTATGSTHSTNLIVRLDGFSVAAGAPKSLAMPGVSGHAVNFFCDDCSSRLWSQSPGAFGDTNILKAGVLDGEIALDQAKPAVELFLGAQPAWSRLREGVVQCKGALYMGDDVAGCYIYRLWAF